MNLSTRSAELGLSLLVPGDGQSEAESIPSENEALALVDALERHGVLGFAARDRQAFATLLPEAARSHAEARLAAGEADARRDRATLRTLLPAWREAGVEVLLLKGASLAYDVFPQGVERRMGDIDVLVEPRELRRAIDVARPLGLVPPLQAMPLFWYRWTHFHAKLAPGTALQREVEVHWALHHDASLFTIDTPRLFAERMEVTHPELGRAWSLSHVDRFLHACTHLASHGLGTTAPLSRAELHGLMAEVRPLIRFKWLLDLHALSAHEEMREASDLLLERARAWGALPAVSFAVHSALALGEEPWLRGLAERLPLGVGERTTLAAAPPTGALDFRIGRLSEWGRWAWPPAEALERAGRGGPLGRVAQLGEVVGRSLRATFGLVPAWIGRVPLRRSRQRALRRIAPESVLDLAAGWRQR